MTEEPQAGTMPPRKNPYAPLRRGLMALGLLCIVWLLFGKVVPSLLFGHSPAPQAPAASTAADEAASAMLDRQNAMESRLDQLEAKLKIYEELIAATGQNAPSAAAPDDSQRSEWQAAIEEKIERLQQPAANETELRGQLDQLREQVRTAEDKTNRKTTALLAFFQIKDAIARGEPYAQPLAALRVATSDSAPLQSLLAPLALSPEGKTPTLGRLQTQFAPLIAQALAETRNATLAGNIGGLVKIRKVGEQQSGGDDESVLARAESKLARGELHACLEEINALSPEARAVFSGWVADAKALEDQRAALDALQLALSSGTPPAQTQGTPETPQP